MPSSTATKAHWASGVSGAMSAAIMLGLHLGGVVELGQDAIMAAATSIGAGAGVALMTWLGTYQAPANRPKL